MPENTELCKECGHDYWLHNYSPEGYKESAPRLGECWYFGCLCKEFVEESQARKEQIKSVKQACHNALAWCTPIDENENLIEGREGELMMQVQSACALLLSYYKEG